jgi:hypothetical protein
MADRINEFTAAGIQLADEFEVMRDRAFKSGAPDIGEENITRSEQKRRVMTGSPQERQAFLQENGLEAAVQLMKEQQDA